MFGDHTKQELESRNHEAFSAISCGHTGLWGHSLPGGAERSAGTWFRGRRASPMTPAETPAASSLALGPAPQVASVQDGFRSQEGQLVSLRGRVGWGQRPHSRFPAPPEDGPRGREDEAELSASLGRACRATSQGAGRR